MKMLEKRILLVVLATALPVLVGGCERHAKSEQYFLIATNIGLPYWQSAHAGFTRAAAEYGVTEEMRGPDTFTPTIEVDEFRAAMARKPAGILVSVADPKLMGPEINKAIAAGIPVITMDSDAPDSQRLYFIGTNNLEAGRLGGQRVAATLSGKGNVVFLTMPGQPNLEERLKGYKDAFANYPGIKIVEVFDMKGESGTAMDKATEYMAVPDSPFMSKTSTILIPGKLANASLYPFSRSSRFGWPGMVRKTTLPLPLNDAATRWPPNLPASRLLVPMK